MTTRTATIILCLAWLVLCLCVGCAPASKHQAAIAFNAGTSAGISGTGNCLAAMDIPAKGLVDKVTDAGKPYYAMWVDLLAKAKGFNKAAEEANAGQKAAIDNLEKERAGWQSKYGDLRGRWWVRIGLFLAWVYSNWWWLVPVAIAVMCIARYYMGTAASFVPKAFFWAIFSASRAFLSGGVSWLLEAADFLTHDLPKILAKWWSGRQAKKAKA